jgi:hypothetical protein
MLELVVCIVLLVFLFIKVYEWAEEDESNVTNTKG